MGFLRNLFGKKSQSKEALEIERLIQHVDALVPQLKDGSGNIKRDVLDDMIDTLRKIVQIDPNSRDMFYALANRLMFGALVRIKESAGGLGNVKFNELPQHVQEEVRTLSAEGRKCLSRYRELKGKITTDYQELEAALNMYK